MNKLDEAMAALSKLTVGMSSEEAYEFWREVAGECSMQARSVFFKF